MFQHPYTPPDPHTLLPLLLLNNSAINYFHYLKFNSIHFFLLQYFNLFIYFIVISNYHFFIEIIVNDFHFYLFFSFNLQFDLFLERNCILLTLFFLFQTELIWFSLLFFSHFLYSSLSFVHIYFLRILS